MIHGGPLSSDPHDLVRKRLARLERRFAVTPAMLHSINAEGRLIAASDAWLAHLGYTRDEVLGRRSVDFLTPNRAHTRLKKSWPNSIGAAASMTSNTRWCARTAE